MSQFRARKTLIAAFLSGASAAVAATVTGAFNISTADTNNHVLNQGTAGTVTSTGSIIASGVAVATSGGGTGTTTVDNSGTIKSTGKRAIRADAGALTLQINNQAGASIVSTADDAIQVSNNAVGSVVTVDNFGTIHSDTARAVNLRDTVKVSGTGSNTITNEVGGILESALDDAVRPSMNGVVTNFGTIQSIATATEPTTCTNPAAGVQAVGGDGIQVDDNGNNQVTLNGIQVTNKTGGLIKGRHGITGGPDVTEKAEFSITITNETGATITGTNGSGINIDNFVDGTTTPATVVKGNANVTNNGTITGNFNANSLAAVDTGDGDGVDIDGLLTLVNNGIIRGTGAKGNGSDCLPNNPEGVSVGGGDITNNAGAEITGQDTSGSGTKGHGILADDSSGGGAFGPTTVTNTGLIRGFDSYAIRFIGAQDDTVTNNAGGTIRGGGNAAEGAAIQTGAGADTVTNKGTITADTNGLAIALEDGDDTLHVVGGSASISGDIDGGAGTNSFDIDPGAAGSFTYAGAIKNFATVEVKSGSVTLSGASTYTGATTVTAGKLLATNSTGSATGAGTTTVKSGATLGGTGTVGAVNVQSGGIVAPGAAAAGTLTAGSIALVDGAKLNFRVGPTADKLVVTGAATFTGSGKVLVNIVDSGIVAGTTYTLVTVGSTTLTTANVGLGTVPAGLSATVEVVGNAVQLKINAPGSGGGVMGLGQLAGLLGMLLLGRRVKRKTA